MTSKFMFTALLLSLTACQSSLKPSTLDTDITGAWHVEEIQGRPVIDYSPAQLTFHHDGTLSGNNSCNSFEGLYQINNAQLEISPKQYTERACIDALRNQEAHFILAIQHISEGEFKRGKLRLTDDEGTVQLLLSRFEPKD